MLCNLFSSAHFLRLRFLSFHLESGLGGRTKGRDTCAFDSLKISDQSAGSSSSRVLCGNWSGRLGMLKYVAKSAKVVIGIQTDYSGNYKGFRLQVIFDNISLFVQ
jgi:hypothetical protein